MKAKIIQIGNSKGLRLSKTILEKYDISNTVEIILEKDQIVIKPIKQSRLGWEEQFELMSTRNDDVLEIPDYFEDETGEEWN